MSFDKQELTKLASRVRKEGVTSSSMKDLEKKASDIRIAYLVAAIKK